MGNTEIEFPIIDEFIGEYSLYGVSREDYADARSNYFTLYFFGMAGLNQSLHEHFVYGRNFNANYTPNNILSRSINVGNLTHFFGDPITPIASFFGSNGREYFNGIVDVPVFNFTPGSNASEDVRTSGALKTGLDAYINNISYAALDAIYTADEETGATRTLDIELSSGVSFNFGFIGGIGLGFVTTGFNNMFSDPLSLTIAVTK